MRFGPVRFFQGRVRHALPRSSATPCWPRVFCGSAASFSRGCFVCVGGGVPPCEAVLFSRRCVASSSALRQQPRSAQKLTMMMKTGIASRPAEGVRGSLAKAEGEGEGESVQYVVVRSDLQEEFKWSAGAVIAQACHAASVKPLSSKPLSLCLSLPPRRLPHSAVSASALSASQSRRPGRCVDGRLWGCLR